MATTFQSIGIHMEHVRCWVCGCCFAVDEFLLSNKRARDEILFCPNGCKLGHGETEEKKLRDKLAAMTARLDQQKAETEHQRRRVAAVQRHASALKGVVTRTKKRIGNGVCPCCNRHFENVERHMATKHPEYKVEDA